MNETIRSILGRRCIRSYEQTAVEKDKVDAILECGQYAPSALNTQPWHFTVVTNRGVLDKISAENKKVLLESTIERKRLKAADPNYDNFRNAPMAIIVSGAKDAPFAAADCANAVENMAIAAYSLGLGSCYIASFKIAMTKPEGAYLLDELGIPAGYAPLYALALGYGDEVLGERAPRRKNTITYID
ncbi:MAG: nitroreductase family protein [Desulfotomaculaceae bacterium]|nr:nitroreductase family protein [Desulfotomaculaceae bacterium]